MKRQERKQFSKQQNRQKRKAKQKRLGVFYVIRITCFNEW